MHLTLVPYIAAAGEIKTKPTQHSVRELRSIGIQPDFLVCRSEKPIGDEARRKIGLFCNIGEDAVISAMDVDSIYEVPLLLSAEGIDEIIMKLLDLPYRDYVDFARPADLKHCMRLPAPANYELAQRRGTASISRP